MKYYQIIIKSSAYLLKTIISACHFAFRVKKKQKTISWFICSHNFFKFKYWLTVGQWERIFTFQPVFSCRAVLANWKWGNAGWLQSYANWGAYITTVINCRTAIKLTTAIWTRQVWLFSAVSTKMSLTLQNLFIHFSYVLSTEIYMAIY